MTFRWFSIWLVAVCVIVFIVQNLAPITDALALETASVASRPWTMLTYIFLHGSFAHLFYNMFALALFGSILERVIGGKRFLFVFFVSGIFAGVGSILFYTATIGASGAIYGVMGTLAVIRARMVVYMGFVPMPMAMAVALWAIGDFIGFFSPAGQTAYASHLFGLAFGLAYGAYIWRRYRMPSRESHDRARIDESKIREWEDRYLP